MLGPVSGPSPSLTGHDPLRSGELPASMLSFLDYLTSPDGVVVDRVSGQSYSYNAEPGKSLGRDAYGRVTGIEYKAVEQIALPNVKTVTINPGDCVLLLACGVVVDSHLPALRKDPNAATPDAGTFGVDAYATTIGPNGGGGFLVIEGDQFPPYVVSGDPGAIGYLDGSTNTAWHWSRYNAAPLAGTPGTALSGPYIFTLQSGPSSTAEAFQALMRWPAGSEPPLQMVKDGMAWMWDQWGKGNFTVYPPLLWWGQ